MQRSSRPVPPPFQLVQTLVDTYLPLSDGRPVLDIGCETGKNARALAKAGHQVVCLDIAPKAVECTVKNLTKDRLQDRIVEWVVSPIEKFAPSEGQYKAVVGTYAFSFIHPDLFEEVMETNILSAIAPGGYFVGGFFGTKHSWASDPDLTIVTKEKISKFFQERGFIPFLVKEETKLGETTSQGKPVFHTISVIAQAKISKDAFFGQSVWC